MKGIYDANGNPIEMNNSPIETGPITIPKEPEVFTVLYQAKVKSTRSPKQNFKPSSMDSSSGNC